MSIFDQSSLFLFEWEDMVRTKDVLKQTIKIFFHRVGEDIQTAKGEMDKAIQVLQADVQTWRKRPRPKLKKASER